MNTADKQCVCMMCRQSAASMLIPPRWLGWSGLPAVAGRRSIIWLNRSADRNWYLGTAGVSTARGITTFWEMLGVTGTTGVGAGMTMGVAAGAGTKKL